MGQYYVVANPDKREFLHPHRFGSGLKLMEFSGDAQSVMQAVAVLLADGNNRGGGDLRSNDPIIGSWAGDRVVVAGDYADDGRFLDEGEEGNLFSFAMAEFEDISDKVIQAIVGAEGACSRMSKLDSEDDGWR